MHGGAAIDTLAMAKEKGRVNVIHWMRCVAIIKSMPLSERCMALLDAELLTRVYLAMTREQANVWRNR